MLVHLETEAVSEPVREVGSVGAFGDYVSVTRAPVRNDIERTNGRGEWGKFG
jgi:hypothetical protein